MKERKKILVRSICYPSDGSQFHMKYETGEAKQRIGVIYDENENQVVVWEAQSTVKVHVIKDFCLFWCEMSPDGKYKTMQGKEGFYDLPEEAMMIAILRDNQVAQEFRNYITKYGCTTDLAYGFNDYLRDHALQHKSNDEEEHSFDFQGVFIDAKHFINVNAKKVYGKQNIMKSIEELVGALDDVPDRFAVKLILTELLTNAFIHGQTRESEEDKALVRIADSSDSIYFEVCDMRNGFEPIKVNEDSDQLNESGRGLMLVNSFSNKIYIDGMSTTARITRRSLDA